MRVVSMVHRSTQSHGRGAYSTLLARVQRRLERVPLAVVAMSLVPYLACCAQTPDVSTPEMAATAYMEALRGGHADQMARLMHPEALALLRTLLGDALLTEPAGPFRQQLFRDQDLASLSDEEFFAGLFTFVLAQDRELGEVMKTAHMTVVGTVPDDDKVHVLLRLTMTIDDITVSKLDVFSVKQRRDRWLGLLTGDLEIMAAVLKETFGS